MSRRSLIQHPNSGAEGGPILQFGKPASSESSASEKVEDIGEWPNGISHFVRSLNGQPGSLAGFIQSVDDTALDYDSPYDNSCTASFEFQRGEKGSIKPAVTLCHNKVAPSKWDDAEKWLVSPTSGNTSGKAKTKSGPLYYVQNGYGGSHPAKRSNVLYQHEWLGHSHAMKGESQTQCASDPAHGGNSLRSVDDQRHSENVKLVAMSPLDQQQEDNTRNTDSVKGPSIGPECAPNFAFMPAPSSSPKRRPLTSCPLADEPADKKEVSISHERSVPDESPLKMIPRTRKPTSDSLLSAAPYTSSPPAVRSISMRDMGTEMTPIASQEPSRTGTPIQATTPTFQSPVSSCASTPRQGSSTSSPVEKSGKLAVQGNDGRPLESSEKTLQAEMKIPGIHVVGKLNMVSWASKEEEDADAFKSLKNIDLEEVKNNVLETRAAAWEEAEQSKYWARFKREEANILAWESHEKVKAEAELRKIEVKVEKIRMRAHEKLLDKLAAARQRAEKRRAAAEEKRCEQAAKTSHQAEYIRQTGGLPSSFFRCGRLHL